MQMEGKLVHVEHMRMRWGDMDALGHMNNAVYFRYFEQARISWFDKIGVNYAGEGPVLASIQCRFRIPIVYPADLTISVHAGRPRNTSFVLMSEITDQADRSRVYATAEGVMVWIGLAEGKSRPLPDWLRQEIQP
jgi:acyl-CoA thioester hydrolase